MENSRARIIGEESSGESLGEHFGIRRPFDANPPRNRHTIVPHSDSQGSLDKVTVPKLDLENTLNKIRDNGGSSDAPRTVDRLLKTLRKMEQPPNEVKTFKIFENRVNDLLQEGNQDPAFRVFAFYDETILPAGSKQATSRSGRPLAGESPLEIIFEFFCGRQQPGTGGMSGDVTFDEIAKSNVCMSLPELWKFTSMMFAKHRFTRNEITWVMSKAKLEPLSAIEENWHGDQSGDLKLLNFVEWLSCILRLTLISYSSLGKSPDEAIEQVAKDMCLDNVNELKKRLYRIARTNGGFGAWVDESMPLEEGSQMALNAHRPKGLQDLMLPKEEMLRLQDKLLSYGRSSKNITWVPFDGPYISMVVPITLKEPHRFQVTVQNMSSEPRSLSFKLKGLPFLHTQYLPSKATIVAAGMECVFDMGAYVNQPGDYAGDIIFTDYHGKQELCVCPVFLRVISVDAIGKIKPPCRSPDLPKIYEPGTLAFDVHSPKPKTDSPRGKTGLLPPSSSRSNKPDKTVLSKDLFMPLTVRHEHVHDPGRAPTSPKNRTFKGQSVMKIDALAPKGSDLQKGAPLHKALEIAGLSRMPPRSPRSKYSKNRLAM